MSTSISKAIEEADSVLLTTTEVDGDAVGAIISLSLAILTRWPQKTVVRVTHDPVPDRYHFMIPASMPFLRASEVAFQSLDLAIVLDGDPDRLGDAARHFRAAKQSGIIDHHRSSAHSKCDHRLHDEHAASTTQLILDLCDEWGVPLTKPLATAIYAGMVFDTSIFRYRLTSPKTLRGAARLLETGIDHAKIVEEVLLQQSAHRVKLRGRMIAKMSLELDGLFAWSVLSSSEALGTETGGLVDELVCIEGVELGLLIVELQDGRVKLSLRSRGQVDVSEVAGRCHPLGGGHARAAGATLSVPLEKAVEDSVYIARQALRSLLPSEAKRA